MLVYIIVLFGFLTFHFPIHAANPMDMFTPSLDQYNAERTTEYQLAGEQNEARISGSFVTEANLHYIAGGFMNMVGCTNPLICGDKPTALKSISNVIAMIYDHPPASGYAYTKNLLANAGLIRPAYAQGIGFSALTPFLPLWAATRNIAYAILIIIMVAIGFMVIFRMHIDPKTVITAQAAIPKILLTLLFITLSYAIVGFLIDIMYLSIAIIVSVILKVVPGECLGGTICYGWERWQNDMMNGGMWVLISSIFSGGFATVDDFLTSFLLPLGTSSAGGIVISIITGTILPAIIGVGGLSLIFAAILVLGLLFVFIRLLMLLTNSYIQIIISLILGPLLLLSEAIPGRSAFKSWILNTVANLSVFPATAAILMFATYLTTSNLGGVWAPPFLSGPAGSGQGFFSAFLGLSVIFISPTLVATLKKALQAQAALPVTAGTVMSPLTGGFQTFMGATTSYSYMRHAFEGGILGSLASHIPGLGGGKKQG